MSKKKSKVGKIEIKEPVKKTITKKLTINQGSKVLRIFTQKAVFIEMINFYKKNLSQLIEKEKGILEAFDLPTDRDIKFNDKTFEVIWQE